MTNLNLSSEYDSTQLAKLYGASLISSLGISLLFYILFAIFLPSFAPALAAGKLAWYLSRATGTISYILMAASTIWGLLLSTKIVKRYIPPPLSLAMHNYLSWTSIALAAFHAFILLFDSYFTYTLTTILIPFTGPYMPLWVGLGGVAFYIALSTSASFNFRKKIGQKNWRKLHYLTFLSYIFITLHAIMAGTDSALLTPIFYGSSITVLFLTIFRILEARR